MATEVVMPRQGNTVESCIILSWKKREGEQVKEGETLCEVETDKATFEVPAPSDGTLLRRLYNEGDDVPVLKVIAVIGEPGEKVDSAPAAEGLAAASSAAAGNARDNGRTGGQMPASERASVEGKPVEGVRETFPGGSASGRATSHGGTPGERAISPRARRLAQEQGVSPEALVGSGPGGRIIERDVRALMERTPRPTPAAAALMREKELTAPGTGSGIGGRLRVADLAAAEAPGAGAQGGEAARFASAVEDGRTEIPVRSVRKVTAERMLSSLLSTAQLTMDISAEASSLLSYRAALKATPPERGLSAITIGDMVMFAAARTLLSFKALNAHFLGDKIVQFDHVHLGFAVDTPRGLFVPVVRFADLLSLRELSAEAKRVTALCQEGKATADLLEGASFTITNLGAFGIERFTPVLNPPQVAILGVNTIQPRPVQSGEEVRFAPHIGFSLTIDHQAVDGAPGARFLAALAQAVAGFELLLAE